MNQTSESATSPHQKKTSPRVKLALWLMIGPTALIILTFVLFAVINLVFNPTLWPKPDGELFAPTPLIVTASNVILFITGAIGMITWLPGIITGAVLLATKPQR